MDDTLANIRHERSKKDFPALKLEDGEYVEYAFSRSNKCYFIIWGSVAFIILSLIIVFFIARTSMPNFDNMGTNFLMLIIGTLVAASVVAGLISTKVFSCNKLYITNRRVIQYVMLSPVATSKNVIDLSSIEDASFRQTNIFQKLINIGTLRLSTVGDETTYTLQYTDSIGGDELNGITKLIRTARNRLNNKTEEEN